jgi:hypothetical protein
MGRASLAALRSTPALRRALLSYVLYGLVELSIWVAMVLYAYAKGGAALAGIVAVVELVPAALISPVIVSRADHVSRGTALVLAQGSVAVTALVTTVALLADAPVPLVVASATLTLTAVAVVRPLYFASLPQLAETPAALVSANSLSSVSDGLSYFVGPIIAGVGTQLVGTWFVFLVATVLALIATVLCRGLGLVAPAPPADGSGATWLSAVRGLGALWGEWGALALLLVMATRFVIGGALDILGIAFSTDVLGAGEAGAGLIISAIGIGGLIGAVIAGSVAMRRRLTPVVGVGGLLQGLGLAAVGVTALLLPAMLAVVVCGIGGALLTVAGRTLLQRTSDDRMLARVFAVQEAVALLGWALESILAPIVIEWLSPAGAFVPFGLGCALFTVAALVFIRRLDDRAELHPVEATLLRRVPFLAVLPAYELERLAAQSRWLDVHVGDEVIRQGEPGDRFYVVADGRFSVTIDGARRPAVLDTGDGFGEVALLHAVPRTATITALTAGRLLTVSSDDFLAAVTGSADGHDVAAEVAAAHLRREGGEAPGA